MAQFISDHSPMDDYQRMLRQAVHCIEGVDDNNRLPYDNNEYPDDEENLSLYFHYYKKRTHKKIEWYNNMLEIDKLIKALNELKH